MIGPSKQNAELFLNRKRAHKKAGFTLTELSIVIGIIGLVLGGVWVAADDLYTQKKVNDIERDMRVIANNAILLYKGENSDQTPGGSNYDPNHYTDEIQAGVFPGDFLSSLATQNSSGYLEVETSWAYSFWDGYYQQNEINGLPAVNAYVYEENLINIPDSLCARMVVDFSSGNVGGAGSVIDIYANQTEFGNIYGGTTPYASNISLSRATQACYTGAQNASQIWVIFSTGVD